MARANGSGISSNAKIQRLIDNADASLSLLASLDDFVPGSSGFGPSGGLGASMAMSTDTFHFSASSSNVSTGGGANGDNVGGDGDGEYNSRMDSSVVDLSVRKGFLHVKGVFPDHSVEFVDVDPRFTTIGEMKHALCVKRNTTKDLGFTPREASVMFDGQMVEDDWLVVDCGMGLDGVIYIVKGLTGGFLSTARNRFSHFTDPKLSVSSISSSYGQSQQPSMQHALVEMPDFSQSLSLSALSSTHLTTSKATTLSRHVRPEEVNFAKIASDFYEQLDSVQDSDQYCEKLLGGYIDVLQTRLENLEVSAKGNTVAWQRLENDIKELRDERNTWRLLYELRQICHPTTGEDGTEDNMMDGGESDELRFEMQEEDAIRVLETHNENYKIQVAVKTWLENIAMEKTVIYNEKRNTGGSRTLKLMKKQLINNDIKVQMDPDAVLRDGDAPIVEDDTEDEAKLMKTIWLFIRAGKLGDAIDLCVRLGQSWRAASLSGGTPPVGVCESGEREDMTLGRWGNPFRALWKTTCWRFSEHYGLNLSKESSMLAREYEEIIYAALSGNVNVITQSSLCESWEDHCWAYLNGITEQQQDEILFNLLKVKTQSSRLIVGNNAQYLRHYTSLLDKTKHLKRYQANLDILFEELKGSERELVRMQANQPHRHIQAKLVTAKFEYIVSNILDTLLFNPDDDSYNWDLQLQTQIQADDVSSLFLRFAAHFVLFSSFTGEKYDEQAGHMILKVYIRHLVKHRQLHLVPVYASRLPTQGAIEIYVQMLMTVDHHLEREMCVKRILEYSNMQILSTVLQITVERMLEDYRSQALDQGQGLPTGTTTEADRRRMQSIAYMCFYNEHRSEALYQANIVARQFVVEAKFEALKELFMENLPEDSLGVVNLYRGIQTREEHEIDYSVREFLCWKAYIEACNHYDLWRSCLENSGRLAVYSEEKEFLTELMYHVSRSVTALLGTLHFENGWLLHCGENEQENSVIRELCLPFLAFNLHYVQLESAKTIMRLKCYPEGAQVELARPLLEKSLEVADIVADKHYAVHQALTQEQCRDLLHRFRESSIALVFLESTIASSEKN